jgi:hypothetical protein
MPSYFRGKFNKIGVVAGCVAILNVEAGQYRNDLIGTWRKLRII